MNAQEAEEFRQDMARQFANEDPKLLKAVMAASPKQLAELMQISAEFSKKDKRPHPKTVGIDSAGALGEVLKICNLPVALFEQEYQGLGCSLDESSRALSDFLMREQPEKLQAFSKKIDVDLNDAYMLEGAIKMNYLLFDFMKQGGKIFEVQEMLAKLVHDIDPPNKMPAESIKMLFPCLYVDFSSFDSPIRLNDDLKLNGFYVRRLERPQGAAFDLMIIGNGSEAADFLEIFHFSAEKGQTIGDGLEKMDEDNKSQGTACFSFFFNLMLSVETKALALEEKKEASALKKRLKEARSAGKRKKLEKRLQGVCDKIVLNVTRKVSEAESALIRTYDKRPISEGRRKVSAHIRRSHFRNQRYGKREEGLYRTIFIEAMIINKEAFLNANEFLLK